MVGPARKRQRRDEYRKAQQAAQQPNSGNGDSNSHTGKKQMIELPKKKFYRQRAHANPFSDHALVYPSDPAEMDWSTHYPAFYPPAHKYGAKNDTRDRDQISGRQGPLPEIADIGCGFGGLLVALSPKFPDKLILGLELRHQVLSYVNSRILALRSQHQPRHQQPQTASPPSPSTSPSRSIHSPYTNISALRTNTMKTLPQYFHPHSLLKIFIAFPDPHFKARKHKARIVSRTLVAEYAYVLKRGAGRCYVCTDVEEYFAWCVQAFEEGDGDAGQGGKVWERLGEEEMREDECVGLMVEETEEGKKVERNGGRKFVGVWRRGADPEWPGDREGDGEAEEWGGT